nr:MAG TPA: hypothetical protein [Caudoviricetes sp.]
MAYASACSERNRRSASAKTSDPRTPRTSATART